MDFHSIDPPNGRAERTSAHSMSPAPAPPAPGARPQNPRPMMAGGLLLLVVGGFVLSAISGCTTVRPLNPLSRSHGLPPQTEYPGDE